MTSKHTPGPWKARQHHSDEARFEVYPVRDVGFGVPSEIADVTAHYANEFSTEIVEARANAWLIAAAPELLEAARKSLNYIENTENELGITLTSGDALRSAIAKAEGRS